MVVASNEEEYQFSTKKKISQPPLNLLFNPSLIQRDDIWKIDIVKLLEILLSTLTSSTHKDLRLCGVAILTSTLIHRLKVESIFRLEKIANKSSNAELQKAEGIAEKVPIPEISNLTLPFRQEITYPVSLEDLLSILENMITDLTNPITRKSQVKLEPVQVVDFQDYLIKFEKVIEEFENKLTQILLNDNQIIFNDLVKNMNELEAARYFIAMLYLCMKNKIEIITEPLEGEKERLHSESNSDSNNEKKLPIRTDSIIIISKIVS
jgi:segregation and condensation protein A